MLHDGKHCDVLCCRRGQNLYVSMHRRHYRWAVSCRRGLWLSDPNLQGRDRQGDAPREPAPAFSRAAGIGYNLGKSLGRGSWGRVLAARSGNQRRTAVKIIPLCQESRQQKARRQIHEEVRIWARIGRHPHCVELYEVYADYRLIYMVMERCEAALVHRLTHMQYMGECEIARVFLEMALAVQHLHSLRIVHRDIKSDNYLFATGGTVKLCDFGFAAQLPWSGRLLYGCYGTAPYMSPEMVRNEGHSLSTDVWSLGATAYVLLYGDFPYQPAVLNTCEMKAAISTGYPRPRYRRRNLEVGDPSAAAAGFVGSLLARRASSRPSVAEALSHPFLQPKPATPAATTREPSLVPVIHRARMTTLQFEAQAAERYRGEHWSAEEPRNGGGGGGPPVLLRAPGPSPTRTWSTRRRRNPATRKATSTERIATTSSPSSCSARGPGPTRPRPRSRRRSQATTLPRARSRRRLQSTPPRASRASAPATSRSCSSTRERRGAGPGSSDHEHATAEVLSEFLGLTPGPRGGESGAAPGALRAPGRGAQRRSRGSARASESFGARADFSYSRRAPPSCCSQRRRRFSGGREIIKGRVLERATRATAVQISGRNLPQAASCSHQRLILRNFRRCPNEPIGLTQKRR
ncbi:unnamed protein product [Prorocentrum cordatum]|uniref:Protein kinase domain-containing protein n=1 Tax=Prorocentrum cordatum TaxID=2364126 RepID=A0ABN9YF81_9DINO|nr:unnamed protein product [Polarella glacialis]